MLQGPKETRLGEEINPMTTTKHVEETKTMVELDRMEMHLHLDRHPNRATHRTPRTKGIF